MHSHARTQKPRGLSSPEAEYYGICSGGAEGLYVQSCLRFVGYETQIEIEVDASSAKAMAERQGVGKVRHVEVRYLWIQDKVEDGTFLIKKIPGKTNPADIGTKHLEPKDFPAARKRVGIMEWKAPDERIQEMNVKEHEEDA